MRVVLDTNVLVSGLIKTGKPRQLISKLIENNAVCLSKEIIDEFLDVAQDPKIRKYADEHDLAIFLNGCVSHAKLVRVKSKFNVVKSDPDDDIILRTAIDSRADFVVSGDKHLLSFREFRGIKIVTVEEMLELLK